MRIKIFNFYVFIIMFNSYSKIRDPFSKSKCKNNIVLNALVEINGKKAALINFADEITIANLDEKVFEKWQLTELNDQFIILHNIATNQNETYTLDG